MRKARIKKILLSQVAEFRAKFARDLQMVVDDESDVCAFGDRQDFFRHAPDFIGRRIFCAQLDQITAAIAELLREKLGRAAMQIGRVHEGVKFAVRERFHENNLTANHAKDTKQKNGGEIFSRRRSRQKILFQADEVAEVRVKLFWR